MQPRRVQSSPSERMQRKKYSELSDLDHQWTTPYRGPATGYLGTVEQVQLRRTEAVIQTAPINRDILAALVLFLSLLGIWAIAHADPTKYPQFAQQSLPENVT